MMTQSDQLTGNVVSGPSGTSSHRWEFIVYKKNFHNRIGSPCKK